MSECSNVCKKINKLNPSNNRCSFSAYTRKQKETLTMCCDIGGNNVKMEILSLALRFRITRFLFLILHRVHHAHNAEDE